jgi:hypothetical protein
MDSRVATVRSLFDSFVTQRDSVKASGTVESYQSDNINYVGYSCICGQVFQFRKDSVLRHCRKTGCDASKLQKVDLIKLCCGQYVTQSQVASLFNEQGQTFMPNVVGGRNVERDFCSIDFYEGGSKRYVGRDPKLASCVFLSK